MKILVQNISIIGILSISLFILFHVFLISLTALTTNNFDWQILGFIILSVSIIMFWILLFKLKIRLFIKFLVFIFLGIITMNYMFISLLIPSVNKIIEIQYCIDRGGTWDDTCDKCLQ